MNGPAVVQRNEPEPLLSVRHVCKRFPVFRSPGHRLARALLGRLIPPPREYVALDDVSFDLGRGDALAVVGRNGAGKSTLLQILAGVLEPSSGQLRVPTRVAGLLELGSGFNPEFSGRENIRINAAILGLNRRQVEERLADIVSFAAIGDFVDMPVKTYSSGMFLRLAFSVAIHVEPDLLLVDEALTVGDVFFQQKCYERLRKLRAQGMSVLLVTHSMVDAAEFCNRGIVLSAGSMAFSGNGKEAVEYYFHHERETPTGAGRRHAPARPQQPQADTVDAHTVPWHDAVDLSAVQQFGDGAVKALRMSAEDGDGQARRVFKQGDTLRIRVAYSTTEPIEVPICGVQLLNAKGVLVHGKNSLQFPDQPPCDLAAGATIYCTQEMVLAVDTGEYTLDIGVAEVSKIDFERRRLMLPAEIAPRIRLLCHLTGVLSITVVNRSQGEPALFSHYGAADLPGTQAMAVSRLPQTATPHGS